MVIVDITNITIIQSKIIVSNIMSFQDINSYPKLFAFKYEIFIRDTIDEMV